MQCQECPGDVREAMRSRYAIIHPESQTPMSLARAFEAELRDCMQHGGSV